MIFRVRNPTKGYYTINIFGIDIRCEFRKMASFALADGEYISIHKAVPMINIENELYIYIYEFERIDYNYDE